MTAVKRLCCSGANISSHFDRVAVQTGCRRGGYLGRTTTHQTAWQNTRISLWDVACLIPSVLPDFSSQFFPLPYRNYSVGWLHSAGRRWTQPTTARHGTAAYSLNNTGPSGGYYGVTSRDYMLLSFLSPLLLYLTRPSASAVRRYVQSSNAEGQLVSASGLARIQLYARL